MAIKEGRVNIELAQSSKEIAEATMHDSAAMKTIAELTRKDSSAMKSIAVLTMIFLPATTVAVSLIRLPSPQASPVTSFLLAKRADDRHP